MTSHLFSPLVDSVMVAVHPGTCQAAGQSPTQERPCRRDHPLVRPVDPPERSPAVPERSGSVCQGSTGRTFHQSVDECGSEGGGGERVGNKEFKGTVPCWAKANGHEVKWRG